MYWEEGDALDLKWQGWLKGGIKSKFQKSLGLQTKSKKNPWTKIKPPKNHMPNFQALRTGRNNLCKISLVVLYSQDYVAKCHYSIVNFQITPKQLLDSKIFLHPWNPSWDLG